MLISRLKGFYLDQSYDDASNNIVGLDLTKLIEK